MIRKLFFVLALLLVSGQAFAEPAVQVKQTVVTFSKKTLVEANIAVPAGKAQAFWTAYDQYSTRMGEIQGKMADLIGFYSERYDGLSAEEATRVLDDYFQLESDRLALRSEFRPKFEEILEIQQVLRLYQIENKLEAIVRYGLADTIPLADGLEGDISIAKR